MEKTNNATPLSVERGGGRDEEVVAVATKQNIRWTDFVLRFVCFLLTLVAAIVMGVDKQSKIVSVQINPALPPIDVPFSAKSIHLSAFVYFVVVNAIASAYALATLILTLANKGKYNTKSLVIIILDIIMVALLFSGDGAAGAIGILGYKGNTRVRWNKVCNVFGRFCGQVAAAIGLSLVGSALFLLLVLLATITLHKKQQ